MNKQNIFIGILIAIIFFGAGTAYGPGLKDGNSKDRSGYRNQAGEQGQMHRMADGTMMHDDAHTGNMDMKSMMDSMMSGIEGKTGDQFDKAFLAEMIVHHEGAVVMAEAVLKNSKRPELIKLAGDIITAQTGEISMMKNWLATWFK